MFRLICKKVWLVLLAFQPATSLTDTPLLAEYHPVLLAVTVTDSEDSGYGDYHATWYVYEAVVDEVVAGEFWEDTIRYAVFQPPLAPKSPAQFILVIEFDNKELEEKLGIKYDGIGGIEIEDTVCFVIDPAEVFPDNSRFEETVPGEFTYSFSGACYYSEALLSDSSS